VAYTDPATIHDPAAGTAPPASWGDAVRDDLEWFANGKPRARVTHSSNQSISNGVNTAIQFNSERYDVGGCHSTSSNTTRLTVPTGGGGLYHIGGSIHCATGSGSRILSIRVNGSTSIAGISTPGDTTVGNYLSLSTDYELADGDYVELVLYQDSGGNLTVSKVDRNTPEFWFRWVANVA